MKYLLPCLTTSMCIYKFTCSCGAQCIGRTTRRLSKQINKHCPFLLLHWIIQCDSSSILAYLVNSGHHIDSKTVVNVIHRKANWTSKCQRAWELYHIFRSGWHFLNICIVLYKIILTNNRIHTNITHILDVLWKLVYLIRVFEYEKVKIMYDYECLNEIWHNFVRLIFKWT